MFVNHKPFYALGRHRKCTQLVCDMQEPSIAVIYLISTLSVCLSILFKAAFMWLVCWAFDCDKVFIPLIIINDVIWRVTKCCVCQGRGAWNWEVFLFIMELLSIISIITSFGKQLLNLLHLNMHLALSISISSSANEKSHSKYVHR